MKNLCCAIYKWLLSHHNTKTKSFRRKRTRLDTLDLSRRPPGFTISESMLKLLKPAVRKAPVKQLKFKTLLKSLELVSNQVLTTAVSKKYCKSKLDPEMDSQSERRVQNLEIKWAGVQHVIRQENST